ncbi:MAG: gephyrin-like molybdotransferase Glp [Candidatus Korobacteraceae bacterium]
MASTTAVQPKLLSFSEARDTVEQYASRLSPTEPEMLSLLDAAGLVLAEDLRADRDFPPFRRATRDGYAVRAADVSAVPARLHLIGEIKAGASSEQSGIAVASGETAEIMTGAPVPSGADAVVMVEYTARSSEVVTVQRAVQAGENIVAAGSEATQGTIMVARGTRITHTAVAVAAAVGRPEIAAYRRPRVAILATGDELVDINLPPGPNEIRNSNSYSLAAQVLAAGCEPLILPIAPDSANELALLLRKGLEADLLLVTGGVSMGKYDLVEQVLASFEGRFLFTGARIQPGKPVVFGEVTLRDKTTPFFGLPGNPASTMVTFQLFARPVLDALSGATPQPLPFATAALKSPFATKTGLTRFLPAKLGGTHEKPEVELIRWQGSGDLMAVSHSNCYIVVPPEQEHFAADETVTVLLF